jgi:hypothetical protein
VIPATNCETVLPAGVGQANRILSPCTPPLRIARDFICLPSDDSPPARLM